MAILIYQDDLAGAEVQEKADVAYSLLDRFCERTDISESKEKACAPSTKMIFVGVLFDTIKMTLEISPGRLVEIRTLVSEWLKKTHATRKELQSLLGKLSFVSSCVGPGRIFVQRLLSFLRAIYSEPKSRFELPEYIRGDLKWWDTCP